MTEYIRVLHDSLTGVPKGSVMRASRFDENELVRLRAAGAIEDAPDAKDEYPAIDAEPWNAETLSKHTMPNIPTVDVDPDTVRAHMGVPREAAAVNTAQTVTLPSAPDAEDNSAPRQTVKASDKPSNSKGTHHTTK